MRERRVTAALALLLVVLWTRTGRAQQPATGTPATARAAAPIDLTGYWVSLVTEDWRWRMVTPAKGDYASVPLNAAGRNAADEWDLAVDKAKGRECRAFGAAALLRLPLRVHVTWQDDQTLKLESDAGQQTRLFRFAASRGAAPKRDWQGASVAEWFKQPQSFGFGPGRGGLAGGNLKVVTTRLRAGYLRKNGVPYSENTVVTEYFNRHSEPGGAEWFTLTSVVEDPTYLTQPFITSSSFKREPDGSRWHPTPCETDPPR